MTKYAESALKAQSHTHRWWPVSVLSSLKGLGSALFCPGTGIIDSRSLTSHILAVWSAEQVARCLTSGERRTRVM